MGIIFTRVQPFFFFLPPVGRRRAVGFDSFILSFSSPIPLFSIRRIGFLNCLLPLLLIACLLLINQDATSPLAFRSSSLPPRVEATGESSSNPPILPPIRPSRSSVSSPSGSKRTRASLIDWIKNNTTLKELESSAHTYSDLDTMSETDLKKLKRMLEKRQAAKKQYQKNKKVRGGAKVDHWIGQIH